MLRFEDRVALVTGGARGIGEATARRFAAEGAAVVIADMDESLAAAVADSIVTDGGRAIGVGGDVSDPRSAEAMVDRAAAAWNRLDILVTCAGIIRDNLIHKMTLDDWDSVIDTHLKGTFLCAQVAQRYMVQQRYGKLVFISSISAQGNRGQANYSAAKAGIEGLTKTLAIELGPFGINVNTVAPGFVDTRMARAAAKRLGKSWEEFDHEMSEATPLRRTCRPEDIAAAITWLCSADSEMITGQVIHVKGGP